MFVDISGIWLPSDIEVQASKTVLGLLNKKLNAPFINPIQLVVQSSGLKKIHTVIKSLSHAKWVG